MNKYKQLAGNTIILAIAKFSSKFLTFLLMPFVTRIMGTGDYGSADLIQQTVNVLIPIVFLQVNSACLRFALDKDSDKSAVFTVGIKTTFIGFFVFLLLIYPVSRLRINDFEVGSYIGLIYIFTLVSGLRQLCQQFVRGCSEIKIFAVDGIIATATNLAFMVLFLGVFKWGVTGYIMAIVASDACSVAFLSIKLKLWRFLNFKKKTTGIAKEMLSYSIPMIPTIILWWFINVSDRYMVTFFINSSANGLYTVASKIPNFIMIFSTIFMDAWQISAVDEFDSDDRADFFSTVFRVYSGGIFTVSSILIIACRLVTKILVSDAFYESWKYVPTLIIATSISCLVVFLASTYMAEKKNGMAMVTAILGAGANLGLNMVLIPKIGTMGAAVSTVISFAVIYFSRIPSTKKIIDIKLRTPLLLLEVAMLTAQCIVMLKIQDDTLMYIIEAVLFLVMLALNYKQLLSLFKLLFEKFIKKKN